MHAYSNFSSFMLLGRLVYIYPKLSKLHVFNKMKLSVVVGILALAVLVNSKPAKCPKEVLRAYKTALRVCKKLKNQGNQANLLSWLPSEEGRQEHCRCLIGKFQENEHLARYADACPERGKPNCRRLSCIRKKLRKGCPGIRKGSRDPKGGENGGSPLSTNWNHQGGDHGGLLDGNEQQWDNNRGPFGGAGEKPLGGTWEFNVAPGEQFQSAGHGGGSASEHRGKNDGETGTAGRPRGDNRGQLSNSEQHWGSKGGPPDAIGGNEGSTGSGGSLNVSWGSNVEQPGGIGDQEDSGGSPTYKAVGRPLGDSEGHPGGAGGTQGNAGRGRGNDVDVPHGASGNGGLHVNAGGQWNNDGGIFGNAKQPAGADGEHSGSVGGHLNNNGHVLAHDVDFTIGGSKEKWNTSGGQLGGAWPHDGAGNTHGLFGNPHIPSHDNADGTFDGAGEHYHHDGGERGSNRGIFTGDGRTAGSQNGVDVPNKDVPGLHGNAKIPNGDAYGPLGGSGSQHEDTKGKFGSTGNNLESSHGPLDTFANNGGSLESAWGPHEGAGGQWDKTGGNVGSGAGALGPVGGSGSPVGGSGKTQGVGQNWNNNGAVGNGGSHGSDVGKWNSNKGQFGDPEQPGAAGGNIGKAGGQWDNSGHKPVGGEHSHFDADGKVSSSIGDWSNNRGQLGGGAGNGGSHNSAGRDWDNKVDMQHGATGKGGLNVSAGGQWNNDGVKFGAPEQPTGADGKHSGSVGGHFNNNGQHHDSGERSHTDADFTIGGSIEKWNDNGEQLGGAWSHILPHDLADGTHHDNGRPHGDAGMHYGKGGKTGNALPPLGSVGGHHGGTDEHDTSSFGQNWDINIGPPDAAANNGKSPESVWGPQRGATGPQNNAGRHWGSDGEQRSGNGRQQGGSGLTKEGTGGVHGKVGEKWDKTEGSVGNGGVALGPLGDSRRPAGGAENTQGSDGKDWNINGAGGLHGGAGVNFNNDRGTFGDLELPAGADGGNFGSGRGQWDNKGQPHHGGEHPHDTDGTIGSSIDEWSTNGGQLGGNAGNGWPHDRTGSEHGLPNNPHFHPHGGSGSPHEDDGNHLQELGSEKNLPDGAPGNGGSIGKTWGLQNGDRLPNTDNVGQLDFEKVPNGDAVEPLGSPTGQHGGTDWNISSGQKWDSSGGQLDAANNFGSIEGVWESHGSTGDSLGSAKDKHQVEISGDQWNHGGPPPTGLNAPHTDVGDQWAHSGPPLTGLDVPYIDAGGTSKDIVEEWSTNEGHLSDAGDQWNHGGPPPTGLNVPHTDVGDLWAHSGPPPTGLNVPHTDVGDQWAHSGPPPTGLNVPHTDVGDQWAHSGPPPTGLNVPHTDVGDQWAHSGPPPTGLNVPHTDVGDQWAHSGPPLTGLDVPHIDVGDQWEHSGPPLTGLDVPPHIDVGDKWKHGGPPLNDLDAPHIDAGGTSRDIMEEWSINEGHLSDAGDPPLTGLDVAHIDVGDQWEHGGPPLTGLDVPHIDAWTPQRPSGESLDGVGGQLDNGDLLLGGSGDPITTAGGILVGAEETWGTNGEQLGGAGQIDSTGSSQEANNQDIGPFDYGSLGPFGTAGGSHKDVEEEWDSNNGLFDGAAGIPNADVGKQFNGIGELENNEKNFGGSGSQGSIGQWGGIGGQPGGNVSSSGNFKVNWGSDNNTLGSAGVEWHGELNEGARGNVSFVLN